MAHWGDHVQVDDGGVNVVDGQPPWAGGVHIAGGDVADGNFGGSNIVEGGYGGVNVVEGDYGGGVNVVEGDYGGGVNVVEGDYGGGVNVVDGGYGGPMGRSAEVEPEAEEEEGEEPTE